MTGSWSSIPMGGSGRMIEASLSWTVLADCARVCRCARISVNSRIIHQNGHALHNARSASDRSILPLVPRDRQMALSRCPLQIQEDSPSPTSWPGTLSSLNHCTATLIIDSPLRVEWHTRWRAHRSGAAIEDRWTRLCGSCEGGEDRREREPESNGRKDYARDKERERERERERESEKKGARMGRWDSAGCILGWHLETTAFSAVFASVAAAKRAAIWSWRSRPSHGGCSCRPPFAPPLPARIPAYIDFSPARLHLPSLIVTPRQVTRLLITITDMIQSSASGSRNRWMFLIFRYSCC